MDIGIKVTKQGKNITSANLYDYNLWSKNPTIQIGLEGEGVDSESVDSGFGYESIWFPYTETISGQWYLDRNSYTDQIDPGVIYFTGPYKYFIATFQYE
jgi:hypothetical protein